MGFDCHTQVTMYNHSPIFEEQNGRVNGHIEQHFRWSLSPGEGLPCASLTPTSVTLHPVQGTAFPAPSQLASGNDLFQPVRNSDPLECLTVTAKHVIVGNATGKVVCMDRMTGVQAEAKRVHSCNIKDVITNEGRLYTCSLDGLTKCFDLESFSLISIFEGAQRSIVFLRSFCMPIDSR